MRPQVKRLSCCWKLWLEACVALRKLGVRTLGEAIDGYLSAVATVKRVDIGQAIEQFIESRRLKTIPRKEDKRPPLSPEHHYNTSLWLREFGKTFPSSCRLRPEEGPPRQLYAAALADLGPKTRNERRGVVKMFLRWCVEKDYLAPDPSPL